MFSDTRNILWSIACCVAFSRFAFAAESGLVMRDGGPDRILAIGGSITEIIYALEADDKLVAVDSTSQYPPEALNAHPNVGYMRTLSAEPVLSVNPELILAIDDAGPPEVLAQLQAVGVEVITIRDEPSIEGVYKKIRKIAGLLNLEQRGARLIEQIAQQYQQVSSVLSTVDGKPDVLFLLSFGRGAPIAAGKDTSAHSMITLAGGNNVMSQLKGYKAVTPEAVTAAAPGIIVVLEHVFTAYGEKETFFALPELVTTPAAKTGRLVVLDALYLIGFGPRTPDAIRDLAIEFHPDVFAALTATQ